MEAEPSSRDRIALSLLPSLFCHFHCFGYADGNADISKKTDVIQIASPWQRSLSKGPFAACSTALDAKCPPRTVGVTTRK